MSKQESATEQLEEMVFNLKQVIAVCIVLGFLAATPLTCSAQKLEGNTWIGFVFEKEVKAFLKKNPLSPSITNQIRLKIGIMPNFFLQIKQFLYSNIKKTNTKRSQKTNK